MNTDKKLFSAGILVLALGLGCALWLGIRTQVIDLEALFAAHHQEDDKSASPGQDAPGADDAKKEEQIETNKEDDAKVDIPLPAGNNPPVEMTPTAATPVQPTEEEAAAGVIGVTEVQLPESAFSWAKKGYVPREGDIIQIQVREGLVYQLVLHHFDRGLANGGDTIGMGLDVKGVPGGSATIVFNDGRLLVTIVDPVAARVFNISYVPSKKGYVIREVDSTKRHEVPLDTTPDDLPQEES